MCCGTVENSYKTVAAMRIILLMAHCLTQAIRKQFSKTDPKLIQNISEMATSVKANTELAERIARKFRMKNTTGYSLNALINCTDLMSFI